MAEMSRSIARSSKCTRLEQDLNTGPQAAVRVSFKVRVRRLLATAKIGSRMIGSFLLKSLVLIEIFCIEEVRRKDHGKGESVEVVGGQVMVSWRRKNRGKEVEGG